MQSGRRRWGGLLVLLAGLALRPAGAQERQQPEELGPPARPISVLLADRSEVTVTFSGDYGLVRVTGILEETPKERLKLADAAGRTREALWSEVRSLSVVRSASEGLPLGSYLVYLTGDTPVSETAGTGGYLSPAFSGPGVGQAGWRLLKLPEGQLTMRGESYGRLTFAASRLLDLAMQPVTGTVVHLPRGNIRVEVIGGTLVNVPLEDVQSLRRDITAGIISIVLGDGQIFSGKLGELPRASIAIEPSRGRLSTLPPIPLERIAQLEVRLPTGAGSAAVGGGRRF